MRGGRRAWAAAIVVIAALLAAIGQPDAVRAAGDLERATLVLVRTTDGPASFDLTTSVVPGERGGFTGFVGARVDDGKVRAVFPGSQLSHGRTDDPTLFGAADEPITMCSLGGPCGIGKSFLGFLWIGWGDEGGANAVNRVFVVLEGDEVDYKLEARGWKLVEADYDFRYVDGQDADAVGVSHTTHGAELLMHASAPGGARGSIAQAVPPCSQAMVGGAARGVGDLTLDGGVTDPAPSLRCPTGTQALVDHADGATTWEASGRVAGQSDLAHTHLFVVDPPAEDAPVNAADTPAPAQPGPPRAVAKPPAAPSAPAGRSADPSPAATLAQPPACRPSIRARRAGRTVRVQALSATVCRVRYKLVARGRVVARGITTARPGRTSTTTLRLRGRRAGLLRLVVDATDAAGNRTPARTLALR